MTAPTPVVIVQDKKSLPTLWGMVLGGVAAFFIKTWAVMVLLPYVLPGVAPSFWRVAAGLVILAVAVKTNVGSLVRLYTRDPV